MTIDIKEARFDRDVATFLTMNPKYTITWRDTVIEGQPADGGGKTPKWHDSHIIEIGHDPASAGVITIVFTDDNDLICEYELDVNATAQSPGYEGDNGTLKEWYECTFEGEKGGVCKIHTKYGGYAGGMMPQ